MFTYHQLSVAILERSSGISIGILLAVHHAALHSLLNLQEQHHYRQLKQNSCCSHLGT